MLAIHDLRVVIDQKEILRNFTLEVSDGEIVGLLGPSGSGKTTFLKAVAGLVEITEGDIAWDGASVVGIPTHRRGFGLMFQGYALFPHLDVAGNVGFGLRMSRSTDVEQATTEALEWVGLRGYGHRSIDSLSGGEQQRVALARTLAPRPSLVMLDEPLGALDRNLRQRLMIDTRRVLDDRGVTALVVTHDREEAASMTDRLAIIREGTMVQTGTLEEILANPADEWVSSFIG